MFTEAFPILTTPDLSRALGFYRDLLGGRQTYRFPDEGPPVFVTLQIGSSTLGVGEDPAIDGRTAHRIALCVYAEDCDEAVGRLREHGTRIVTEPEDQRWGERMARVEDPDGNRLIIVARP